MIINPPISKKIKDILKNNIKFSIFVHEHPDYDALGSANALARSLKLANKQARIFGINQKIIEEYPCLDLTIEPIHEPYMNNSVAIILDVANKERILSFKDNINFINIIRIDHHLFVEKIGNVEWIDDSASSTAEMVGWLIVNNNLKIDEKVIDYLYAGILADTGKLMFSAVSQSTYELLSEFMSYGFNKQKIQEKMFLKKLSDEKINNKLQKKMKVLSSGIGYIILNKRDVIKYKQENIHNKVWLLSGYEEIKIWFYLYFDIEKNSWKGSIRSRDYNVNQIAKKFNGGGHLLASGFRLENKKQIKNLINEIEAVLNDGK